MPFPIDSNLVPIDAFHVSIEGAGISVDWVTAEPASGWVVGDLTVEDE